jgi:hypothetical protein
MRADDEPESGSDDDNNNAFYLQGFYTFLADHNPFIVPLVRFDFYQTDDGKHDITAWTVALTYYPLENIKLTAEYWDRKGSGDVADDNRVTLQINAFF